VILIKNNLKIIKKYGIFILVEVLLAFIMGLFNLLGMNTSLSKIIIFITNIIIFFGYGYISGKTAHKKGFEDGMIQGLTLISILFVISIIFFHKNLSLGSLLYYLVLLITTIISGIIGKNKKEDSIKHET
jgi:putative membrane protein (TIGR04086 family)